MALVPAVSQTTSTGSIIGQVVNAKGVTVPSTVQLRTTGSAKVLATVKSTGNGFSFSGLAAGFYEVCATPSTPGYVDSCLWGRRGPVRVTAGQTVNLHNFVLETAGTLNVQVNDPSGTLPAASSKAAPGTLAPHLLIGVVTDHKLFISMPVTTSNSTGRNHALAVPVDRNVALRLVGQGITVATAAAPGTNLAGKDLQVKVSSTQANAPVVLTVQGGGK
jgi:hypothetical protein